MSVTLTFTHDLVTHAERSHWTVIGRKHLLGDPAILSLLPSLPEGVWTEMLGKGDPGDHGRTATTYTGTRPSRLTAAILPEACSRHNTPSRAAAIPGLVKTLNKESAIVAVLERPEHALAFAAAIARCLHRFPKSASYSVPVRLVCAQPVSLEHCQAAAEAVLQASEWVDTPPNVLDTHALVARAQAIAERHPQVEILTIQGQEVAEAGLGGIWAVGQASISPPAFVVLDYRPSGATQRIGWVGKGITYDTGGLSLKSKFGMPSMKNDMAGAAAVLSSFEAAVRLGYPQEITAVLCIAENSVGPNAMRPDDIITLFSGQTVEVNNTDAEGRLILADGLAWLVKNRNLHEIVDLATLTGHRLATGKRHAGFYCNEEAFERRAVAAGHRSGDLGFPLFYAPEFLREEFQTSIADMKNSAKDRENAPSSAAAQFLAGHLGNFQGGWLHVDMAAPAFVNGRGTGFGVALLLALYGDGA